jgi:ABC-type sugar transport system permease subunit
MAAIAQENRTPSELSRPKPKNTSARRETKWGLIFLSPWIIGFLLFTLIPMVASLVFSVTDFKLLDLSKGFTWKQPLFANYQQLFNDPQVGQSLLITFKFALIAVPIGIFVPLGFALLVNAKNLFGKNVFRAMFYMPQMISAVAVVVVFGQVLNSESGWLNALLGKIGIQGPRWFQDEAWVIPALALMTVWSIGGTMITMLAGLQNVPTELYEAARVDGAGPFRSFFNITMPMISPVIFYNLVLAIIGSFQVFIAPFIIGNGRGDPNGSTYVFNLYLYKTVWGSLDMSYGATLAWAMFVICLILTVVLFRTQRRWVYYAGGGD